MALDLTSLTPAQLKELAALMQKANLTAVQDELDKQQGARLHDEKNAPWAPGGYYEKALKDIPPYRFREYPKMLYSADYVTAQRAYEAALRFRESRDQPGLRNQLLLDAQTAMQHACRTVENGDEERLCLESGLWAATPALALEAEERRAQAIAQAAAEAAWDDRRLSSAAQAERAAADAAAEDHLIDVPAARRGPGRPRKDP